MFSYKTYEEATKMKESISRALLGVDKNVVYVSTEEEKIGDALFYSVKIGLENGPNIEVLSNIFEHLKKANIVSESFEDMASAQADCLSTFVEVGTILPFEHVSTDDNLKSYFLTKFFNFTKLKNQQHIRPITPGFSVGHEKISAEIVGTILTDQNSIHHMLSNSHVLAKTNQDKKGNKIIQPGFSDRGKEKVGLIFANSLKNSFANHYSDVDSVLTSNNYNTRFAKSTVNSDPLPKLNFLYNRTLMRKSLALSTLVGTIGLATYATSSIQKIKPNPDKGKVSPNLS